MVRILVASGLLGVGYRVSANFAAQVAVPNVLRGVISGIDELSGANDAI